MMQHLHDELSEMRNAEVNRAKPAFVLGCAKLGSVLTPLSDKASIKLIARAWDLGIRHFDTASIYGQGDSERLLGRSLRHKSREARIASKAGQQLSAKQAVLAKFKRPIRWLAHARPSIRTTVQVQRQSAVRWNFEPTAITNSLQTSLQRLELDRLDVFYLHSPPPRVLESSELLATLDLLRARGMFVRLGVSCDNVDTLLAAARCPEVAVIQCSVGDLERSACTTQDIRGKGLVLRGITPYSGNSRVPREWLGAIEGLVLGTTNLWHLEENVMWFRQNISSDLA